MANQSNNRGPGGAEEGDRGLKGALGGAVAGGAGGKFAGHGVLGAVGGAILGHLTEEQVKKHKEKKNQQAQSYGPYDGAQSGNFGK